MPLPTQVFTLIPPVLPADYCFISFSRLAVDLFSGAQVVFNSSIGNTFFNQGSTTPSADNRIYPWLNSTDGRWYVWSDTYSLWVSPMDPSDRIADFRKMWKPPAGTLESAVWALDGGDGVDPSITAPTPATGAAWEVDHDFDGVFPIGVGAIPTSDPPTSVVLGATGGSAQHTLTEAEGGTGSHIHGFGKYLDGASSFRFLPIQTVPSYTGVVVQGISDGNSPDTVANLFTLPAGATGAGNTPTSFGLLPPYRAIYWIKPTAKKWFTLPG